MYPRLFEIPEIFGIGPLTIYTYGVMLAAAYLAGLQLAIVRGRKAGLDAGRLLDLGVYLVIAALVGAKLLLLLINFSYFRNNPDEILVLARSGGVFYGGLITATLVAFWYIRRHTLPFWTTCDMFAPGIALGHVIGRMGCLMAGCCYGREAPGSWLAVTFPQNPFSLAPAGIPLLPSQLFEAAGEIAIFLLLSVPVHVSHFNNQAALVLPKVDAELVGLKVDILIPAGIENSLTSRTAPTVKAKIVLELANGPTTPEGDAILDKNGVLVVPDFLANSGGVTVSYFEQVQNAYNYYWDADEVYANLARGLQLRDLLPAHGDLGVEEPPGIHAPPDLEVPIEV